MKISMWSMLFLIMAFLLSFMAFAQIKHKTFEAVVSTVVSGSVPSISATELAEQLDEVTVYDCRDEHEFVISRIKDAVRLGYDDYNPALIKDLPKDAPIVVYCSIGYRSEKIGEKLKDLGYTNVKNLYGGIFSWVNAGLPIYNPEKTEKIHGYSKTWSIWLTKGEPVF